MSDTKLSFAQKVSIVFNLICGETPESIASEFDRTVDEINFISNHHWSIVEVSHYFNNVNHIPVKGGLYPLMENILFGWYKEQQNVTNKQLAEKAKVILDVLNEQPSYTSRYTFTASKSWISGFKTRFGIAAHNRKTTPETDAANKVSAASVIVEDNDSSSESRFPEESQHFTTVKHWSDEDSPTENEFAALPPSKAQQTEPVLSVRNKEDMENRKPDAQKNPILPDDQVEMEPDINQWSTGCNSFVADNANENAGSESPTIEAVVSLATSANKDFEEDDMFADDTQDSTYHENLTIQSAVSLAEADVLEVDRSITVYQAPVPIDSTYSNLKIVSVVSLAEKDVQDVDIDSGTTPQAIQNSTKMRTTDSVVAFSQKAANRSRNVDVVSTTPKVIAIVDLTEDDDDSEDIISEKRKRTLDITDEKESKRSRIE